MRFVRNSKDHMTADPELKSGLRINFSLPDDPIAAAVILQQYLSFACSGMIEIVQLMEHIDGWFTSQAGAALYTSALLAPTNLDMVEIGSFKGRSTVLIGFAIKVGSKTGKLYAVDPHLGSEEHQQGGTFAHHMPESGSTYDEFLRNIKSCELHEIVVPLRSKSVEAARRWSGAHIGLLFIDGDHSIEGCEGDFLAWDPFLTKGGIILLHDVGPDFPGPAYVVDKYLKDSSRYKILFQVDSLLVALKVGN